MRNRPVNLAFRLAIFAFASALTLAILAQTFDDPEAEIDDGLEAEVAGATSAPDAQLDESLVEEYIEENQPEEVSEDQLSAENDFDTFIPSEDISEDFSVPFPVDI